MPAYAPLAQTLIVTFGCGLHQRCGGSVEEIPSGDVMTVGSNEKHWHGASPSTTTTHIAIQVTDEQYQGVR